MSQELLKRYRSLIFSLNTIRVYTLLIVLLAFISYTFKLEHFQILTCIIVINSLINLSFLRRLCSYLERINEIVAGGVK